MDVAPDIASTEAVSHEREAATADAQASGLLDIRVAARLAELFDVLIESDAGKGAACAEEHQEYIEEAGLTEWRRRGR